MKPSLSTKFKIKKGILTRFVNEKAFLLDTRKAEVRSLNETASLIWKSLKKGATVKEIIKSIVEEYQVDKKRAKKDVFDFVEKYLKEELIVVRKK